MKKILGFLLVLAIMPSLSFSQVRGGDIYGTVVLEDGSKIPGVLVTITGNRIGTLRTDTNDKGNFRFLSLPPGKYNLTFELEGFETAERKGVDLNLGKSETLDILMETITQKKEITVSERGGVIDSRANTNPGYTTGQFAADINISKEFVESIPTARNPWAILSALPGVLSDRVDPGGADSGQPSNFISQGWDQDDHTWSIDGVKVTDPNTLGTEPAYYDFDSFEEIRINSGASDISAQTGGMVINIITKRGGNYLAGKADFSTKTLGFRKNPTQEMKDNGTDYPAIKSLYQYGVNLGGPIVKDKLWFFGSWAVQDIKNRNEADLEDSTWLASGYGKLNFQMGDTSGDFHVSYDAKNKWGRPFLSPTQQDEGSLWDEKRPGYMFSGGLSHMFGELMLNLKTVYTDGGFTLDPRGADINPQTGHSEGDEFKVIDGGTQTEGSALDYNTNRNTLDMGLDGNYFLEGALGGDHEIRFGVDYFTADTTTQSLTPNQRIAYVYRDDSSLNYLRFQPDYYSDLNFKRISAYIQDTVTFGKLTASCGLRYDKEQGKVNPFTQPASTWYEPGSPYHNEPIWPCHFPEVQYPKYMPPANWSLISPRVAFTYDITGDGKNVVKLSAARYMSQSGTNLASYYTPSRFGYANWYDENKDEVPQAYEVGDLFYSTPFVNNICPVEGTPDVKFDPHYNTPYLDELTLMFEKALSDDLSVSLTGFLKKNKNIAFDVDSNGDLKSVNTGIMPDGTLETKDNWMYTGTTQVGGTNVPTYQQIVQPVGSYYYNKEKAYDRYTALQLLLSKKFSNKWMANFSFTYQDWKRYRFEDEEFNLNNFDFFNEGVVAPTSTGSGLDGMFINSRWMAKFTGMYQLPWGINLVTFFQAREGNPQPLRRSVILNQGNVQLYREGYKLGDERLPTFWMLNLGLEKTLKVTDTVTATLVLDWYNATNNQIELKHNISIGGDPPGDPKPIMWSNAGLFQFGVRVSF